MATSRVLLEEGGADVNWQDNGGSTALTNGGDGGALLPSRLEALESSEAAAREELGQLKRVVLALDQRLRALEGGDDGGGGAGAKRPR